MVLTLKEETEAGENYGDRRRQDAKTPKWLTGSYLAAGVDPAIGGIEHREHGAALGRLANLARSPE